MADNIALLLERGFAALTRGASQEAADCCRRALAIDPKCIEAHFLVGLVANARGDARTAASAFGSVTRLEPGHAAAWAQLARVFMLSGQPRRADQALAHARAIGTSDPTVLDTLGSVHTLLGDQPAAVECYTRAVAARPDHVPFQINLANAHIFLGNQARAKAALDAALQLDPRNPQAHWLLSTLVTARDHRHLETLETLVQRTPDNQSLAFLHYAAGKEHEDLEEWPEAFTSFAAGAHARRQTIEFDEAAEVATFAALEQTLTEDWFARAGRGHDRPGPIFVVGQPRTGTTLVERIISSHSMVHSAGELQQFRLSIRRLVGIPSKARLTPEIIVAAAKVDPEQLGEAYLRAVATQRGDTPYFVDKLPPNYLFLPLIASALPQARIVHLTRNPMDACFASFKQLFADAYPHSYDQAEMARHYLRYHRLMQTWHARLPGRIIDIGYEDLVADLEPHARRLIEAVGLPWEDGCLEFHRQAQAVTTASAVQVREPAHTRSVGRWRRYEAQLAPMRAVLGAGGLSV